MTGFFVLPDIGSEVADLDYVQSRCKPGDYRFAATVYVYSGSCEYANQAAAFGPVDNDGIAFGGYSYAVVMLDISYSREICFFDIEEIAPYIGSGIGIFTSDGNIQCGICVYFIAVEYPPVRMQLCQWSPLHCLMSPMSSWSNNQMLVHILFL